MKLTNENQILNIRTQHEESNIDNKNIELEFELLRLRERYNELIEHTNTLKYELNNAQKQLHEKEKNKHIELEFELLRLRERYSELIEHTNTLKYELNNAEKQLHEKEKIEPNLNVDLEKERRRADEFENDYKSLKIKYDDVCERIRIATHQLEHVQIVLEETSRRCEQLEKEKSEINAQSEYLSQNVLNVTSKYKDKLNTIKVRLEQAERERREVQLRNEQFQNDIERLKDELLHKKELIFEKEKIIQDTQYKNREILLERQSIEERISNEYKRLNELVDKEEKDRNGEIQQLIARAEFNARQYMTALNLTSFTSQAALVKIMPLSSTTKIS
ncbi:unnamed protein product [Rotaria sp. Silwood1]|nr:unnamed protein product [Rotaria sp. Silwood1]